MTESNPPSGLMAKVEARYQPLPVASPTQDSRLAIRMAIWSGLGATINILVIGIFLFVFDEPATGGVAVATGMVYLLATLWLVVSGDATTQLRVIFGASFLTNTAVQILLGGFAWSGGALFWGVLVSSMAGFLLGRNAAITFIALYGGATLVLAVLEPTLQAGRNQPDLLVSTVLAADTLVISLLILVPVVYMTTTQLLVEQQRSESLLLNVFPQIIAKRLKEHPGVIADGFDSCSVLFADLVGFTKHSGEVPPETLVEELNTVFSRFDDLVASHGAEKIKTIGDGYLVVAGAPKPDSDHVNRICALSLDMVEAIPSINAGLGTSFELRIGVNTGRVVAGVIGHSRFSYDIWGDTVNVASRLQSGGEPGAVMVSSAVAERVSDGFVCSRHGMLELKGLGATEVFRLERAHH